MAARDLTLLRPESGRTPELVCASCRRDDLMAGTGSAACLWGLEDRLGKGRSRLARTGQAGWGTALGAAGAAGAAGALRAGARSRRCCQQSVSTAVTSSAMLEKW